MKNAPTAIRFRVNAMPVHPTPANSKSIMVDLIRCLFVPPAHASWRGDAAQCIDRVFPRTGNIQQQETSHNAEVLVKALHFVELIHASHCPIAMFDERGSERVKNHE